MPLTDHLVEQQPLGDAGIMQQDTELLLFLLIEALEALDASRDVCGGNPKPVRVGAEGESPAEIPASLACDGAIHHPLCLVV